MDRVEAGHGKENGRDVPCHYNLRTWLGSVW
jgi:hypothetical protein